jgi:hypothetical protein
MGPGKVPPRVIHGQDDALGIHHGHVGRQGVEDGGLVLQQLPADGLGGSQAVAGCLEQAQGGPVPAGRSPVGTGLGTPPR